MNTANLPMTGALSDLAAKAGVEFSDEMAPLARSEMAFNDMLANAGKFDGSFEEAQARFHAAIGNDRRAVAR